VSEYVTDTHSLYWHLTSEPRLSAPARKVFLDADKGIHRIWIPGIALIEMVYLVERGRLAAEPIDQLFALLANTDGSYIVAVLNQDTARALRAVPRSIVADMPDRIVVATARQLGLPLISRDAAIRRAAAVPILW
jgi:PIN domain nuclease of toxin-antitoxin system